MAAQQIQKAIETLRRGGLVAYPTDTVYGLGADMRNETAVRRVFAVKQRPLNQPLPVLAADMAMLERTTANLSADARLLVERFMPGALTLVLPRAAWVPGFVTAGQPTIGVRIPGHDIPRVLAAGIGVPIVGTSANLSGQPSARTAAEARRQLGDLVDYVIDGDCFGGKESTVVDMTQNPPLLLRDGPITMQNLAQVLGRKIAVPVRA
ncbi:MAG: threonylcarbamoyl-AMP synthase [Chloroflexi bacterium]|nr:threonylcarbamoyl-AMP synthase [Chloroflexota bacterium]